MKTDQRKGVAALERALEILNVFRSSKGEKSLIELSEATGMYKSTILRLCVSLERYGYLSRKANGNFVLGAVLFELGNVFQRSFQLADHVRPILGEIAAGTQESATLWIKDGQHRVCLFRAESTQRVRDAAISEGDRLSLDNGATSNILRSFSVKDWRQAKVRPKLIAVALGDWVKDLAGVSCPVFQADQLLGAITVAGPTTRFTPPAVKRISTILYDNCRRLTRSIGGDASVYDLGGKSKDSVVRLRA